MTEVPNPGLVDADTLTKKLRPVQSVVLSLGSNLGERLENLQGAIDAIGDTPEVWVTAISPVYETEPVNTPAGSGSFLNIVVLIDTTLLPTLLLDRLLLIEDHLGRIRTGELNGPRTLDIDIVMIGDMVSRLPKLLLPHPQAHQRAFVLAPWHDVDAEAVLTGHGSVAALLAAVGTGGVVRRDDLLLSIP